MSARTYKKNRIMKPDDYEATGQYVTGTCRYWHRILSRSKQNCESVLLSIEIFSLDRIFLSPRRFLVHDSTAGWVLWSVRARSVTFFSTVFPQFAVFSQGTVLKKTEKYFDKKKHTALREKHCFVDATPNSYLFSVFSPPAVFRWLSPINLCDQLCG